jgi:hypothetical protein
MSKRTLIIGAVIAAVVGWGVYEKYSDVQREARDRKAFPYLYEPLPPAKYKTNAEAVAATETPADRAQRNCAGLRRDIRDKRVGDLTVRETEMLSACRALGW